MTAIVKASDWTGQKLTFAVGCFHFGFRKKAPYEISVTEYVEEVSKSLNALPAINNVSVELLEGGEQRFGLQEEACPSLEDGYLFPFPHYLKVKFDIFIPYRIQDEIRKGTGSERCGSENFTVYISHEYHSPVSFVVPVNPSENSSPSSAIPVVREYLRREMNSKGKEIEFEALGPSPIHANFYLFGRKNSADEGILVSFNKQHGYSDVGIVADPGEYNSIDECFDHLRYLMSHEIDDYYWLRQLEMRAFRQWSDLQDMVANLTSIDSNEGLITKIFRRLRRSRDIGDLHSELISFDSNVINAKHATDRATKKLYGRSQIEFIRPIIEDEVADQEVFPTEQIQRLVLFLEQRRSKAFELFVLILASLVGGAVGGIITASLST